MTVVKQGETETSQVGLLDLRSFLAKKLGTILAWPLAAMLVAAIGWLSLSEELERHRRVYEHDALAKVAASAQSYADSLQRTLELLDQITLHVRYESELKRKLRLVEIERDGLFPFPSLLNVTIVDQTGKPTASNRSPAPSVNLQTSDLFVAQRAATEDALYLGKPAARTVDERNMIQLSRKLTNEAGAFDGVAVVSATPDYLSAGHDRSSLGSFGFIGFVRNDGSTYVPLTGYAAQAAPVLELASAPGFPTANGSSELEGDTWFSDKRDRYVGWHVLAGYPVIAMVGLDRAEVLSPWESNRALAVRTATGATVALFLFALLGTGISLRLAWRKHKLDMIQATYRMATEGGTEGFFIGQPLRERDSRIDDIRLVDCNKRAAGFLRRRREEVIGKNVSALYEGQSFAALMECVNHAMEAGTFEGEMKVSDESPLCLEWIHLKIVRSNRDIAITIRDISDTKSHVAELERQSNEDVLTKLPNRHWFQGYLPRAIERAATSHDMLALLFLDLDGFKAVNDTMGHPAGDELLQKVAQRLRVAVRPHDCVVRLGGDEFVVIVEHVMNRADVQHLATRILLAFQENFGLTPGTVAVGTSVGISMFPVHGEDADTLIKHADIALYWVKGRGKGRYAFYDQKFSDALHASVGREKELRAALKRREFTVLYQPRVATTNGRVLSMEALVRWAHPSKGLLQPNEFIGLAEQTGLIVELGKMVLETVFTQIKAWEADGKQVVPVSINVSYCQFVNSDMVELLAETLARYQIPPTHIQLELKESVVIGIDPDTRQALKAIQQTGIKLLVDNYGSSDLSIATLQTMAFDLLKVDCGLTAKIGVEEEAKSFFAAVITMAHALGMHVVAEGVETHAQASALRELHCDEIQGFHVFQLLTPEEAGGLLRSRQR